MNRVPVLVLALALAVSTPSAEGRDTSEAYDFLIFLQSVAAQRTARMCERGLPAYRQKFDDLYGRWSAKYAARIARGESAFRTAMAKKDDPYTDYAKLEQVEKAMAELAQSPSQTSPITLDEHWKAICEEILTELDKGLQS
jgi:hypothetical protein